MSAVLVIDDEPDILRLVESVLVADGHQVVTASNAERALEKARKHGSPFDLLITDVVMPGLSGPMVAERLSEQCPTLKVLFISGFNDRQVVRRYVTGAGYALLSKPFRPQDLSKKVKELLQESGRSAEEGA